MPILALGTFLDRILLSPPVMRETTTLIEISTSSLEASTNQGESPVAQTFQLSHSSEVASLNYSIESNADWVSVSPSSGTLAPGQTVQVTVTYETAGLLFGTHTAVITVNGDDAPNSPQLVDVSVIVSLFGDYYLSPTGNDANDGLTRETAWATVAKANATLSALSNQTKTLVVTSGTYAGKGFEIDGTNNTFTIQFEPNVTINTSGELVSGATGINTNGGNTLTYRIRGASFIGTLTASANGISTNNSAILRVYGSYNNQRATFTGFDDGLSTHGTSTANRDDILIDGCSFSNCNKSAFALVNNSWCRVNNCVFTAKAAAALGIGDDQSSPRKSIFTNCEFLPVTANQAVTVYEAENCKFGSFSLVVNLNQNKTVNALFTDCFINSDAHGPWLGTFTRCYGFVSFSRIRGNAVGPVGTWRNCVFKKPAASSIFANGTSFFADPGYYAGAQNFQNCIFVDYTNVVAASNALQIAHINANWILQYNCLHNVATPVTAGLTINQNNITSNPLLGSLATTNKADWGYGVGSPCIGAGAGGANIGFAAA